MIKRLSIFGLFAVAILTGYLIYGKSHKEATKILGSENPEVTPETKVIYNNQVDLVYNNQNLTIAWAATDQTENLDLIPNFDAKLPSAEVKEKFSCKFLTSAGFYSKEGGPIGLFIENGNKINSWQKNSLLNGVFSVNLLETPRITRETPKDQLRLGIQSGPIIKENGKFLSLSINNDNPDRRVAVAINGENKAVFLIIYDKNLAFSGPKLSDLPKILKSFEEKSRIIFADIINLDGGTASTFNADSFTLPEVTNVGSFFCLKP
jgi:hypothetical protein